MHSLTNIDRTNSTNGKPVWEVQTTFRRVYPLVIAIFFFAGCSSKRATIYIPAEQEFVLGAEENQNFRVDLKNTSSLPVAVTAVDKNTESQTRGFSLPAQGSARVFIGRKEKVLLKNPHPKEIRIKARLSKGVAGMSYRPLAKSGE